VNTQTTLPNNKEHVGERLIRTRWLGMHTPDCSLPAPYRDLT
jgi:hypothetical protein